MLASLLDRFRGKCPVFLLPVTAKEAVQTAYSWGARTAKSIFFSVPRKKSTAQGDCNAHFYAGDRIILLLFVPVRCTKPVVHFPIKWSDNLIRFRKFSTVLCLHNPNIQSGAHRKQCLAVLRFFGMARLLISCGSDLGVKKLLRSDIGLPLSPRVDQTIFLLPLIFA